MAGRRSTWRLLDDLREFVDESCGAHGFVPLGFARGRTMSSGNMLESAAGSSPMFLCSWCGGSIGPQTPTGDDAGNFGICSTCLESELASLGASAPPRRILKRAPRAAARARRAAS
jgi:hypothetical protein